jgi:hypothetical protein
MVEMSEAKHEICKSRELLGLGGQLRIDES